jgi:hypothetical protein
LHYSSTDLNFADFKLPPNPRSGFMISCTSIDFARPMSGCPYDEEKKGRAGACAHGADLNFRTLERACDNDHMTVNGG